MLIELCCLLVTLLIASLTFCTIAANTSPMEYEQIHFKYNVNISRPRSRPNPASSDNTLKVAMAVESTFYHHFYESGDVINCYPMIFNQNNVTIIAQDDLTLRQGALRPTYDPRHNYNYKLSQRFPSRHGITYDQKISHVCEFEFDVSLNLLVTYTVAVYKNINTEYVRIGCLFNLQYGNDSTYNRNLGETRNQACSQFNILTLIITVTVYVLIFLQCIQFAK